MGLFSIFDSRTGLYNPPFNARSEGDASRMVALMTQNPESMFSKFPEDYVLYHLGNFNEDTGMLEPLSAPVTVARVSTIARVSGKES